MRLIRLLASCAWAFALAGLAFNAGCGRERSAPPPTHDEPAAKGGEKSGEKAGAEKWTKGEPPPVPAAAPLSPLGYTWDGQYAGYNTATTLANAVKRASAALYNMGFQSDAAGTRVANDSAVLKAANEAKVPIEVQLRTVTKNEKKEVEIKVKVGATGDRGGAERLLDEIRKELAKK